MKRTSFFSYLFFLLLFSSCFPFNNNQNNNNNSVEDWDTIIKDLAYGMNAKQKMDLYLPEGRHVDSTKIIVMIHGGAWAKGSKSEMDKFAQKIHQRWPEVAVANINYRLANGNSIIHTEISEDLQQAVQFLVNNKYMYDISTNMAMMGQSAGAHLSLLYAYKLNTDGYVKAVCNLFGPSYFADWNFYNTSNILLGGPLEDVYRKYVGEYWNDSLYKSLSPYHLVNVENYVPTITFHGTSDMIVPIYQNRYFTDKLDSLGVIQEYYEYSGQNHGFDDNHNNDCSDKIVNFLQENM